MANILLVDDEEDLLTTVAEYLESEGHRCIKATSGRDALLEINTETFDLVISDLMMPEMDGLELVQVLRDLPNDVPVIWLSGHATNRDFLDGWRSGLCDFLEKPVKFKDLRETIRVALSLGPQFSREHRILSQKKK